MALRARAVLVADPDPEARARVIGGLGSGTVMGIDVLTPQALMETTPDAVIISSPSGLHYTHAIMALSQGLPTFVEKPLACTAADATALSHIGGDHLVISEQRIYRRDIRLVRALIRSGCLGRIHRLTYHDSVAPYPKQAGNWRDNPKLAGGGVLLDLGYHTIGTIQWLLDQGAGDFTVFSAQFSKNGPVESEAKATGEWGNIEIDLDIRLDQTRPREELTIYGTRAEAQLRRYRAGRRISLINLRALRGGSLNMWVALGGQYDNKALRKFVSNAHVTDRSASHVETLKVLELIYMHATKGVIAACSL
jgi:predicted dehydrogenase